MGNCKDLCGQQFSHLTAVYLTPKREKGYAIWHCKCDCGNEVDITSRDLLRGIIKDCGCVTPTSLRNGNKAVDMTGMKFGKLTALKRVSNENGRTQWLCQCECGNTTIVKSSQLRSGKTRSCGCLRGKSTKIDITGKRIGMLTVIKETGARDYKGSVEWLCKCDCGAEKVYSEDRLLHGHYVSCGCYKRNTLGLKLNSSLHRIDGTCIERLGPKQPRVDNKCGYTGVSMKKNGRYQASIGFKGKQYYLGTFNTLSEAVQARQEGEKMHTQFLEWYEDERKKE